MRCRKDGYSIEATLTKEDTKIIIETDKYKLEIVYDRNINEFDIITIVKKYVEYKNNGMITDLLIKQGLTIATMESCTSGLIASTITDYEGASAILKGSLITYSNEMKMKARVSKDTIMAYGVYSQETADEMAIRTKEYHNSDIGLGITGSFGNVDPNSELLGN